LAVTLYHKEGLLGKLRGLEYVESRSSNEPSYGPCASVEGNAAVRIAGHINIRLGSGCSSVQPSFLCAHALGALGYIIPLVVVVRLGSYYRAGTPSYTEA
jgi:hypothetical protein